MPDGDVFHEDVSDLASSACVGLDAQHPVEVGRVHVAVVGEYVPAATAYLRTDDYTSVSIAHLAMPDDDVLAWHGSAASVSVASALYGYAVVASVEVAVFYQHPVARLWVATVAVGPVIVDAHSFYCHIFRLERMDDPEW